MQHCLTSIRIQWTLYDLCMSRYIGQTNHIGLAYILANEKHTLGTAGQQQLLIRVTI